jgi:hypothetical protein
MSMKVYLLFLLFGMIVASSTQANLREFLRKSRMAWPAHGRKGSLS